VPFTNARLHLFVKLEIEARIRIEVSKKKALRRDIMD